MYAVFKKQGFSIVFVEDETSSLSILLMIWEVESGVLDKTDTPYTPLSCNILKQAAGVCVLCIEP